MGNETKAPVEPGDVLAGKYRVDHVLGAGGMGVVVAATNVLLDKRVALKFLLSEALSSPEVLTRFNREAKAAASLQSEHVAKVQDIGTLDDGAPFIVMEYLEGHDLADHLAANGPLQVAEAVDYILQACEALAEAHSVGLVHRDIKPANLFLTTGVNGRPLVKVLDFGIAKRETAGATSDHSLTKTSTMMGSPLYMSPEQMRSAKDADHRSDIWALGVILYELLAGRPPFEGETLANLLVAVMHQPALPIENLRADLPAGLAEVITHILGKERDTRPQHVGELANVLRPYAFGASADRVDRISDVLSSHGQFLPRPPPGSFADITGPYAPVPSAASPRVPGAVTTGGAQLGASSEPGPLVPGTTVSTFSPTTDDRNTIKSNELERKRVPLWIPAAALVLVGSGIGVWALSGSGNAAPGATAPATVPASSNFEAAVIPAADEPLVRPSEIEFDAGPDEVEDTAEPATTAATPPVPAAVSPGAKPKPARVVPKPPAKAAPAPEPKPPTKAAPAPKPPAPKPKPKPKDKPSVFFTL